MAVDFGDAPIFALLPVEFRDGVIELDLGPRLLTDAPDDAGADRPRVDSGTGDPASLPITHG